MLWTVYLVLFIDMLWVCFFYVHMCVPLCGEGFCSCEGQDNLGWWVNTALHSVLQTILQWWQQQNNNTQLCSSFTYYFMSLHFSLIHIFITELYTRKKPITPSFIFVSFPLLPPTCSWRTELKQKSPSSYGLVQYEVEILWFYNEKLWSEDCGCNCSLGAPWHNYRYSLYSKGSIQGFYW